MPTTFRRLAAALLLTATLAACGEGGDSDDREMPQDPSTQPNGAVRPDSSTQTGSSIAPGATATSQGSTTGATVAPGATATPPARP